MGEEVVHIENLSFTYWGSSSPVLKEINLQINQQELVTITGPSGCGKSTLSLCMAGFIPYSFPGDLRGRMRILGKDIKDDSPTSLSGMVGLVQQDPEAQLCTLTVKDELAFGLENLCIPPDEIKERIKKALKGVLSLDLYQRQVHTLSGGEKQRVAIASVLAMNPSLLILDEPTSFLDPKCTLEVFYLLEELKKKKKLAIIIIEHRLKNLISITDRLLKMKDGRIEEIQLDSMSSYLPQVPSPSFSQEKKRVLPHEESPILMVKDLSSSYGEGDILTGVSFNLYKGETVAVMGDNGSGKTSLLLALLGMMPKTGGSIILEGQEISAEKVSRRAGKMGLTFQNPNHQIFEKTVFKEASLPSLFLRKEEFEETNISLLLQEFQLFMYKERNPFTLSLGEKKRLTLVSVLAYSPLLLIMDEPLVGQDSQRLLFLIQALKKHSEKGGATLMVCHEPEVVASLCHRILFFHKGRLLINNTTPEAFAEIESFNKREYLPERYLSANPLKED